MTSHGRPCHVDRFRICAIDTLGAGKSARAIDKLMNLHMPGSVSALLAGLVP